MALTAGGAIHVFAHPVVKVRRDDEGRLLELLPREAEGLAESLIHVEVDRQAEQASRQLTGSACPGGRVRGGRGLAGDARARQGDRHGAGRGRAPIGPDEL